MAVDLIISRNIDDKFTQVDAKRTRTGTHYYKVPKENIDQFCSSYKNFDKKRNLNSDFAFFGSIIIGSTLASFLTKNLSDVIRGVTMIVSALTAGFLGDHLSKKAFIKKHDKLIAQFNAQEINYNSTTKVTDLIK